MNKILKSLLILIIILLSSNLLYCNDLNIAILLPKKRFFRNIVNCVKKRASNIKIINIENNSSSKNFNLILTNEDNLKKALKYNKPIFLLTDFIDNKTEYKSHLIKQIFLTKPPITLQLKYALKILEPHKNLAIVVHNMNIYKKLKKLNINNIKIFQVKNIGDVPYIINKALTQCDALLTLPDKTVFNYFSIQFIFKKAILMGKYIIGTSEDMLNYGAYAVITPNCKEISNKIYNQIIKYFKTKNISTKIIYPENFKIIKNKNL